MTDRIFTYLADQLRMHGLSFLLLAAAVWYFQGENMKMANEIKACNQSIIDMYRTDRMHLQEIIDNNTRALEEIKAINR